MNSSALIIIDIQNDYFPNGLYPQWQAEQVLANTLQAVDIAQRHQMPIILVQHIADPKLGSAPFFNANTEGAELHPKLVAAAPEGIVVVKAHADSFLNTDLTEYLQRFGVSQLYLCGMMTQNCITHTALSLKPRHIKFVYSRKPAAQWMRWCMVLLYAPCPTASPCEAWMILQRKWRHVNRCGTLHAHLTDKEKSNV